MAISKSFATALNMSPGGTPASSRTTATFNSTGFTHVVVGVKLEGGDTTITASDNKSSTGWVSGTKEIVSAADSGNLVGQFLYSPIGSPGTGHTVTITLGATRTYITVAVWLINTGTGAVSLVSQTTDEGTGTVLDAGTLDNAGGLSVVSFMMFLEYAAVNHTGGAGWTEDFDLGGSDNFTAGYSRGAETTTSIDPAGGQDNSAPWGALGIMFAEAAGGATTDPGVITGSASILGTPFFSFG